MSVGKEGDMSTEPLYEPPKTRFNWLVEDLQNAAQKGQQKAQKVKDKGVRRGIHPAVLKQRLKELRKKLKQQELEEGTLGASTQGATV